MSSRECMKAAHYNAKWDKGGYSNISDMSTQLNLRCVVFVF